jgi:hypothetical protein
MTTSDKSRCSMFRWIFAVMAVAGGIGYCAIAPWDRQGWICRGLILPGTLWALWEIFRLWLHCPQDMHGE